MDLKQGSDENSLPQKNRTAESEYHSKDCHQKHSMCLFGQDVACYITATQIESNIHAYFHLTSRCPKQEIS